MDDDTKLYEMLMQDLVPLGMLPAPTAEGRRWGRRIGSGWIMVYFPALAAAEIMWAAPGDHADAKAGKERTFEDSMERMTRLGQIHAALKPLGYDGEVEIGANGTPMLILTDVPTR